MALDKSAEVCREFEKQNTTFRYFILLARVLHISRAEFERMTVDEIIAAFAYIKEYKLYPSHITE